MPSKAPRISLAEGRRMPEKNIAKIMVLFTNRAAASAIAEPPGR
jgi:hypothetical protein